MTTLIDPKDTAKMVPADPDETPEHVRRMRLMKSAEILKAACAGALLDIYDVRGHQASQARQKLRTALNGIADSPAEVVRELLLCAAAPKLYEACKATRGLGTLVQTRTAAETAALLDDALEMVEDQERITRPQRVVYRGLRNHLDGSAHVVRMPDGRELDPCLDIWNHSAAFDWGYGGSGPAQLALAILADATGDHQLALRLHMAFKWATIALLPQEQDWELEQAAVLDWIEQQRPEASHEAVGS